MFKRIFGKRSGSLKLVTNNTNDTCSFDSSSIDMEPYFHNQKNFTNILSDLSLSSTKKTTHNVNHSSKPIISGTHHNNRKLTNINDPNKSHVNSITTRCCKTPETSKKSSKMICYKCKENICKNCRILSFDTIVLFHLCPVCCKSNK